MFQIDKAKGLARGLGRACMVVIIVLSLGQTGRPAQASPLNLTLQSAPDIFSDAIEVSFDAASQTLTASGFAQHIKDGGEQPTPIVNGSFEVSAKLSNTGAVLSGSLTVTGEVPSLGIGPGPLLAGNIKAIGYGEAGEAVEFEFDTTGGALSYQYGPIINVILGQSGFPGSFAKDFSNGSIGVAGIGW